MKKAVFNKFVHEWLLENFKWLLKLLISSCPLSCRQLVIRNAFWALLSLICSDLQVMVLEGGKRVPLLKSDGSTLYLSRDVAAALDRWVTFRFDRMQYVVDNSQNQHFSALSQVIFNQIFLCYHICFNAGM